MPRHTCGFGRSFTWGLVVGSLVLIHSAWADSRGKSPAAPMPHVPGYVVIKLKSGAGNKQQHAALAQSLGQKFGAREVRAIFPGDHTRALAKRMQDGKPLPDLSLYYKLLFAPNSEVPALCRRLQATGAVEYAEPSFIRQQIRNDPAALLHAVNHNDPGKLSVYTPNDPRFGQQNWITQVKAPQAWDTVRADSTVIIGMVDSGCDFDHPDLIDRIWVNPAEDRNGNRRFDDSPASSGGDEDGIDNDNNGFIDDVVGWDFVGRFNDVSVFPDNFPQAGTGFGGSHGVETSGCASATADNNFGIAGAGFRSTLMITKHGSDAPSANNSLNTAIFFYEEGVMYHVLAGADIISMSFGGGALSLFEADVLDNALRAGVLLVASTGNGGADGVGDDNETAPHYPSNFPGVLAVGAVQSNNRKSTYSNFGRPKTMQLFAPGDNVLTTTDDDNPNNNGQQFLLETGTSFSTPIVAGIAALVKKQNPGLTGGEIFLRLCGLADNLDNLNPGFRGRMGYGIVNAQRATTETTPVFAPDIDLVRVDLDDAAGGIGNGVWDAGETVGFIVRLRNVLGDASNVQVTLSVNHWAVTLVNGVTTIANFPGLADYANSFVTIGSSQLRVQASAEALPDRIPFRLRVSTGAYSEEFTFAVTLLPSILFVDDDDGNNNIEDFYLAPFSTNGLGVDYWSHLVQGTPPADLMKQYSTVVWACEWAFPALDSSDRAELSKYLDAGGNLFLSGQDIGWDLNDPAGGFPNEFNVSAGASQIFYETYLRADYLADDSPLSNLTGVAGDPVSDGLSFGVFQPGRADAEQFPSEIAPVNSSVSIFNYPNNVSGAVRYAGNYRLVHFAFGGYEAIIEEEVRSKLMPRVINWLNGLSIEHTPLRDTEDTTSARLVTAKVTSAGNPLASVTLYWDTDGALPFNKIEMTPAGNGNYSASIPAQSNKQVEYFILARTTKNFYSPIQKYSYASRPDRIPPQLSGLTDLPNVFRNAASYTVAVEAVDNLGINPNSVYVLFRSTSGVRDSVKLNPVAPAGRFQGSFSGNFLLGDSVYYRATARDLALAGNRAVSAEKSFVVGLEDFENGLSHWTVEPNGWGLTEINKFSGRFSANQSPQGSYTQNLNTALTLAFVLDLSAVSAASISFQELHLFQPNQEDFGVLEASGDGQNWTKVSEEFRGVQSVFQLKNYSLGAFTGAGFNAVRLRFRVQTDNASQLPRRGWFVDDIKIRLSGIVAVEERETSRPLPATFALQQNYPNPFARHHAVGGSLNAATSIRFDLPVAAEVDITIYDLLGQRVATLAMGRKPAGAHVAVWQGRNELGRAVANGIYFYRMRAITPDGKQEFQQIRKMMVLE